jgi:hypothetical protein
VPSGPIVTLLTDFGTADSYVAEMKGALLARAPGVTIVDITHEVPPGDVHAAHFLLSRAWPRFPAGTVHVAVVDPGVGSDRRALALTAQSHAFVGPDNGLFTSLLDAATVVALPIPALAAPTFHGRDVFAPAAAALATGGRLHDLGESVASPVRLSLPPVEAEGGGVRGVVLYVDRYGTLITNVPAAQLPARAVVMVAGRAIGPLRRTFASVAPGALVAFVGSGGTLEVAERDGSAAARLRAAVGTPVRVVSAE